MSDETKRLLKGIRWLGSTPSQVDVQCTVVCQVLIDEVVLVDPPGLRSTSCYRVMAPLLEQSD